MKFRVALIGLEGNGKTHFSELRRSDYFELVGIYDSLSKDEDFGRFSFFSDIDEMFSVAKPDAVIISTKTKTHKDIILKSLKYIKNIFVEAPCSDNLSQAREMRYAATSHSAKIAVGFDDRFNPAVTAILREFEKEDKIYAMNIISAFDRQTCDKNFDDMIVKELDLIRFLSSSEISTFDLKRVSYDENLSIAHANLKTKSSILVNLCLNSSYPVDRKFIEISASSGVYLADLTELTLRKITKSGRLNLRVDRENLSIKEEHRLFNEVCKSGEFGKLASIEDAIKIREILK